MLYTLFLIKFWRAIEWNDSVVLQDPIFSVLNSYGASPSAHFINAYYGASGSTYYAANNGSYTILSMEDNRSQIVWVKIYSIFTFRKGFVVENKEDFIYVAQEASPSLKIFKIHANTGNLNSVIAQ